MRPPHAVQGSRSDLMHFPYRAIVLGILFSGTQLSAQQSSVNTLTIARLHYGGGGDWYVGASNLPNLLNEIHKRTGLTVAQPVDVKLTDPTLWNYPFLFITGHGNLKF